MTGKGRTTTAIPVVKSERIPEVKELGEFLHHFAQESDRGMALVAASMLDERLTAILAAFLIEGSAAKELLEGYNAPLGTFSARASAASALGLIQDNEFREISLIRKIRNRFGHGWEPVTFEFGPVADLTRQLPWLGPAEFEESANNRSRFNAAVAILLTDLMWRVRLVSRQQRQPSAWPNKSR